MIKIQIEGLKKALEDFAPKVVKESAKLALNDAVRAGRTEAGRKIREMFNVKAGKVNEELKNVCFAQLDDLTAIIQAKGRPISLTYFGAKEVKDARGGVQITTRTRSTMQKKSRAARGVSVKIVPGKVTVLSKAFIATMKSGYIGVFKRENGKLENQAVYTIASMFGKEEVQKPTIKMIEDKWAERFAHHLDRKSK